MTEPQTRPLGAQISHMLKARGVEVIFGIPGVHNQEMYRGIEEAGLTHVLARHEQGAGFMADGYARATGKPGVAYVITGPGLCNIMTPMGQAYSDNVPMLVISSCLDETAARRGQLHQMKDQRGAAETVSDWSEEARTAEAAYQLIDRALFEMRSGQARPKHIQVPIGLLEAPTHPAPDAPDHTQDPHERQQAIDRLAQMLTSAKRPMFILGGGAAGVGPEMTALAQSVQAAVFTSFAGRGVIAADYPLNYGAYLSRPGSADVIGQADLVIAIGTTLAEVDLWRADLGHRAPLVRIDIDTEVLSDAQNADIRIKADARDVVTGLRRSLGDAQQCSDWSAAEVAAQRDKWRAEVDGEYPGVLRVADVLRACLSEDTMIFSDMTQFAYAAKEVWHMARPGHWHHPYGFGTLGYGLPAAIGGAVARKGQKTLAIAGDYGFHYTMAELGVAVELGLSLPIILWDNGKLGAIEASMIGAQIAPNAVVARNPDFVALARAFGAHAVAPTTLAQMQSAVTTSFEADGPTLIYVTPDIAD